MGSRQTLLAPTGTCPDSHAPDPESKKAWSSDRRGFRAKSRATVLANALHHIESDKPRSTYRPIDWHDFAGIRSDSPAEPRPLVHHGCAFGELRAALVGTFDRIR